MQVRIDRLNSKWCSSLLVGVVGENPEKLHFPLSALGLRKLSWVVCGDSVYHNGVKVRWVWGAAPATRLRLVRVAPPNFWFLRFYDAILVPRCNPGGVTDAADAVAGCSLGRHELERRGDGSSLCSSFMRVQPTARIVTSLSCKDLESTLEARAVWH